MEFKTTNIPDVIHITSPIFTDQRGDFSETYRKQEFDQAGIELPFVQDNHAGSHQGVLRGLHYQIQQVQGKLVRVISGTVYDVAVDLRQSSPTFGQYVGILLTGKEKNQLWVPPGFAHGYYVISEWAEVSYKVTDYYAPKWERTLLWNDPDLKIDWPLLKGQSPLLSVNDRQGNPFKDAEKYDSL